MVIRNGAGLETIGSDGVAGWNRLEQFGKSQGRFEEGSDEQQVIYPVGRIPAGVRENLPATLPFFETARAQSGVSLRPSLPCKRCPVIEPKNGMHA